MVNASDACYVQAASACSRLQKLLPPVDSWLCTGHWPIQDEYCAQKSRSAIGKHASLKPVLGTGDWQHDWANRDVVRLFRQMVKLETVVVDSN